MGKKKAAKKARSKTKDRRESSDDHGEAKFPYTTTPNVLRRVLQTIPTKPKPTKFSFETLQSWDVSSDSNARTVLRVLKAVDLISSSGTPTDTYADFMAEKSGPAALGRKVRAVYAPLFEHSNAPYREGSESLRKLFNIHSGGKSIDHQIQTFKALCESSTFGSSDALHDADNTDLVEQHLKTSSKAAHVHIDLHIHLPANKSTKEYDEILQSIDTHVMGLKE